MHCPEHTYRQHAVVTCPVQKKIKVYVDSVITNVPVSDKKIQEMRQETKRDEQLQKLKKTILEGFPDQKSEVSSSIHEYWNIRNGISYTDGLKLKGSKLTVPKSRR